MSELLSNIKYYWMPFLQEIFNQDSSGKTTVRSLYYQNIIRYFLKDVHSYFKVRAVLNEIIDDIPLRTRSKKNEYDRTNKIKSDKLENREKTFRGYFSQLVTWGILSERSTTMEKGTGSTFEYKITRFGHLLALLIDIDFNNGTNSYDLLYSFIESYFDKESYSLDYFCKVYLKKCKENGLFEIFIHHLRKNILYQNKYIQNENDLFTHIVFLRTLNNQINQELWKLWNDSYEKLNFEIQQLFLYHLKLAIDRIIDETIVNYKEYEDALFDSKYVYDTVIVEYRCLNCDSDSCFYIQMFTLDYLKRLFHGVRVETISLPDGLITCTECNGNIMRFTII